MDVRTLKEYETLSPFEIKDFLIKAALNTSKAASITYLNAGRGNPNWIATEPRDAFFLLGQFAITESKRVLDLPAGVGGRRKAQGIADRLEGWLRGRRDSPGARFFEKMVPWTVKRFGFEPDKFVHELVDSIIGDNYPVPDRMLVHNEQIVHEYLQWAMCGNPRPQGTFKLYAVEGGTAAMCYIFKSMKANRLLNPRNTIGVYSYSKYFGCTGWRLGVIAVHDNNVFDEMIAKHPEPIQEKLGKRYGALTLEPRKLKFIDRIVADSRDIALNHTAGLSLPQQVMMTLFSVAEMMDEKKSYQQACIDIVTKRVHSTIEGLGIEVQENPNFDHYYGLIDLEFWMRKYVGDDVVSWVKANVHPLDIVFKLAEDHGIVLLNGGGFAAPDWSVRVSFANLNDDVYDDIGRAVRAVARGYAQAYQLATGKTVNVARRAADGTVTKAR